MDIKKVARKTLTWISLILFAFIGSLLIQSVVFANVTVNQSSMQNTLYPKQKMILDKLSYEFSEPDRGDIVIFLKKGEKGNLGNEMFRNMELFMNKFIKSEEIEAKHEMLVKRVIGIAGDVVDIKDGFVYVNGNKLIESYAKGSTYADKLQFPITVGNNQLFVLGDNREVSIDSRKFGLIDLNQLEGKAVFRIYPINKIGKIH